MIYDFNLSTPANTSFANRQIETLELSKGVLIQLEVVFPAGCRGLLHVTISNALHQVFPTNSESNFSSDNESISFKENFIIKDTDKKLYANTWNLDDTYEHSVIIRFGIVPEKSWRIWA